MNTSKAQDVVLLEAVGIGAVALLSSVAQHKGIPPVRTFAACGLLAGGLSVLAIADGETAIAVGGIALAGSVLAVTASGKTLGELALGQTQNLGTKQAQGNAGKGSAGSWSARLAAITAGSSLVTAGSGAAAGTDIAAGALAGGNTLGAKAYAACLPWVGTPYSWGGGGPSGPSYGIAQGAGTKGFDCSGLTEYGWYQATGKSIGGTTYAQLLCGKSVPPNDPSQWQIGDLLFPEIGHVQLKGPGNDCIEAPHTGATVHVTTCNSSYWKVIRPRVGGG